jgi:hypothetical protein
MPPFPADHVARTNDPGRPDDYASCEHYSVRGGPFAAAAADKLGFIDVPHQESTVPKSRVRQKKIYTPPTDVVPRVTRVTRKTPSGVWLPVLAVTMIVLGIGWLTVFYLSQGLYPVLSWRYWNLAVGFGAMVSALALLARWR